MKIKNLSASLLEKWDQCPFLCTALYEGGIVEPPSPAASLGSAVHETMEAVVAGSKDVLVPVSYEEVLPKVLEKHKVQSRYREATEMVVQAIRWGYTDGLALLVGVEKEFLFTLPNSVTVHGFIDRLDYDNVTGTLTVYDLKTGKLPPEEKLPKAWQARIYNWAARRLFPDAVSCVIKYLYLRTKVVAFPATRENAEKTEQDLTDMSAAIQATTEPPTKTGPLCDYCPLYRSQSCPAYTKVDLTRYESSRPTNGC